MKLTVEVIPDSRPNGMIEITTYFDDGMNALQMQEVLPEKLCKEKQLIKRIVDRLFYELKRQIYEHFAL